jgi:hypothetical protein
MKRMMHPQHGWHHPMNSGDREDMLKNGWTDEVAQPQPGDLATVEGIVNHDGTPHVFVTPVKRGPGRPRKQ